MTGYVHNISSFVPLPASACSAITPANGESKAFSQLMNDQRSADGLALLLSRFAGQGGSLHGGPKSREEPFVDHHLLYILGLVDLLCHRFLRSTKVFLTTPEDSKLLHDQELPENKHHVQHQASTQQLRNSSKKTQRSRQLSSLGR